MLLGGSRAAKSFALFSRRGLGIGVGKAAREALLSNASWTVHAARNLRYSQLVASRALGSAGMSGMRNWAMVGAGLGAIRGAGDNLIGQDRTSILGGAIQGAVTLGGLRGLFGGLSGIGRMRKGAGIRAGNLLTNRRTISGGRTVGGYGRRATQRFGARRFAR